MNLGRIFHMQIGKAFCHLNRSALKLNRFRDLLLNKEDEGLDNK